MKNTVIALFLFSLVNIGVAQAQEISDLVGDCALNIGDDATYLRDFMVKLQEANDGSRPPASRYALALQKNITYRFTMCNSDKYNGEGIVKIYDQSRLIATNYISKSDKFFQSIDFNCQKTSKYFIVISFKDGKEGEAAVIMSYVRN